MIDLNTQSPNSSLLSSSGVLVNKEDLQRLVTEVYNAVVLASSNGCYYRTAGGMEFVRVDACRALELGLEIVSEDVTL